MIKKYTVDIPFKKNSGVFIEINNCFRIVDPINLSYM